MDQDPRNPSGGRGQTGSGTDLPRELAIWGAPPRFAEPRHVGAPNLPPPEKLLEQIGGALRGKRLTNDGPLVRALEERLAGLLQVRHCVAVANGTLGLELVLRALQLSGEVIVPSFTFVATAHAVRRCGLTPVFCDVHPQTHVLEPEQVKRCIRPATAAILGVHLWGRACAVEELEALAGRYQLPLLFDAAHAFGCSTQGRMLGGFGSAEVFSFHATKFFHTGEGGCITTNDSALADRLRRQRNFGFGASGDVMECGTNAKLSELHAAMGLALWDSIPRLAETNRQNHQLYQTQLAHLPGLTVRPYPAGEKHNYQYVILEIDEHQAGLHRDELLAVLHAENVLARRYFHPGCHRLKPYLSAEGKPLANLPHTEALAERILALPTGEAISPDDICHIAQLIRTAMAHAARVRQTLASRRTNADTVSMTYAPILRVPFVTAS